MITIITTTNLAERERHTVEIKSIWKKIAERNYENMVTRNDKIGRAKCGFWFQSFFFFFFDDGNYGRPIERSTESESDSNSKSVSKTE